jgi:hypothetical protein
MKKFILILMLLGFPFQVSWGAVTAYCQPELQAGSLHCVDCRAQMHASAIGDQDHDASYATASNIDCGYCMAHGVAIVTLPVEAVLLSSGDAPLTTEPEFRLAVLPDRPERPNWLLTVA